MQGFMRWVQTQFHTLILLMLAGGFVMLLAELLLTDHTDGIQLVAVVASVAGLALILAGLFVRGRAAMVVAALLLVLSVTGVVGTVQHLRAGGEGEEGERASVQQRLDTPTYQQVSLRLDDDEDSEQGEAEGEAGEGEAGESEETPPPLAPLSLAGLSLMGALSVVGEGKREA